LICKGLPGLFGSLDPFWCLCFHITSMGFQTFTVHNSRKKVVSSFYTLPLLFNVFRTLPVLFPQKQNNFPEVSCLIATSVKRVHSHEISRPRLVPTSPILTTAPVSSSLYLASLFHPATAYRLHFSGVFPSVDPYELITRRPLLTFCTFSLLPVTQQRQLPVLASRGFCPTKVRYATWGFRPRHTRSPF
jgi:hypothetical protein